MKAHHSNNRQFFHYLCARYSFYTWVRWRCEDLWKKPIAKDFVCPGFHQGSNADLLTRNLTVYHETTDATKHRKTARYSFRISIIIWRYLFLFWFFKINMIKSNLNSYSTVFIHNSSHLSTWTNCSTPLPLLWTGCGHFAKPPSPLRCPHGLWTAPYHIELKKLEVYGVRAGRRLVLMMWQRSRVGTSKSFWGLGPDRVEKSEMGSRSPLPCLENDNSYKLRGL